jgi:hypothetical protein
MRLFIEQTFPDSMFSGAILIMHKYSTQFPKLSHLRSTARSNHLHRGELASWFVVLWVGLLTCFCGARGETGPCELQLLAVFEHAFGDQGTPMVTVTLDGREQKFRLDFSADWSGIGHAEASAAGEPKTLSSNVGAYYGRYKINQFLAVKILKIGGITLSNAQFLVVPPNSDSNLPSDHNVLGQQIFAKLDVELDPLNDRIRILKHSNCAKIPTVWYANNYAVQEFDRRSGAYQIQMSGSLENASERMSVSYNQMLSSIRASSVRGEFGIDADADFEKPFLHQFSSLTIGDDIKFNKPILKIIPTHSKNSKNNDIPHTQITIGLRELLYLHVLISFSDETIIASSVFDEIAAAKAQAEANGTPLPDFESALARIRLWRAGFLNSGKAEEAKD